MANSGTCFPFPGYSVTLFEKKLQQRPSAETGEEDTKKLGLFRSSVCNCDVFLAVPSLENSLFPVGHGYGLWADWKPSLFLLDKTLIGVRLQHCSQLWQRRPTIILENTTIHEGYLIYAHENDNYYFLIFMNIFIHALLVSHAFKASCHFTFM